MQPGLTADAIVVAHFAFIAFVLLGGLMVLWRRWIAALHLPALAWGAYTELTSTVCPLTPLENALRQAAGQAGYGGDFVGHYLVGLIYPPGLTPSIQLVIGIALLAFNACVYALAWRRARRPRGRHRMLRFNWRRACGAPARSSAPPGR
jgi:hypothetical protein